MAPAHADSEGPSAEFAREAERLQDVLAELSVIDWPDLDTALSEIAALTARTLSVRRVSIWRYDRSRSAITCAMLWQDGRIVPDPLVISVETAPNYWAALHQARTLCVDDAERDPATQDFLADYIRPLGIGALMDTSIRAHGDTLGIVCVEHQGGPRHWSGAERVFLGSVGERVGLAIVLDERRRLEAHALVAQRLEAVGLLAASVAHDFNNLVNTIAVSADLAVDGLADGEDIGDDLEVIRSTTRRAADLTRKLLAIARQEEFRPSRHDLSALTRGFLTVAKTVAGARITLQSEFAKDPLSVMIDPGFLDRALLNLVTNAAQAMPNGGTLTIRTSAAVGDPTGGHEPGLPPGRYACVSVADTGVGIAREQLSRIFEPFFTTKGEAGTGLGLAVVYGGMQQHNGHLLVESEPGRGTTFHAYFPLAEESPRGP